MIETVTTSSGTGGLAAAAQLLHDFNRESDEHAPPPDELATRLAELVDGGHVTVLLARSEVDRLAQRLYEAAGFRRTEGEGVINQSVADVWWRRASTSVRGPVRPKLPHNFRTDGPLDDRLAGPPLLVDERERAAHGERVTA